MQTRIIVTRLLVQHVPAAWPKRRSQSNGPEGGSTDSENHDVVVFAAGPGGKARDLIEKSRIAWKIDKPNRAAAPQRVEPTLCRGELLRRVAPRLLVDPARRDHHVGVVEAERHLN